MLNYSTPDKFVNFTYVDFGSGQVGFYDRDMFTFKMAYTIRLNAQEVGLEEIGLTDCSVFSNYPAVPSWQDLTCFSTICIS